MPEISGKDDGLYWPLIRCKSRYKLSTLALDPTGLEPCNWVLYSGLCFSFLFLLDKGSGQRRRFHFFREPHVARRCMWRRHHPQRPNTSCLPEGLRRAPQWHADFAKKLWRFGGFARFTQGSTPPFECPSVLGCWGVRRGKRQCRCCITSMQPCLNIASDLPRCDGSIS